MDMRTEHPRQATQYQVSVKTAQSSSVTPVIINVPQRSPNINPLNNVQPPAAARCPTDDDGMLTALVTAVHGGGEEGHGDRPPRRTMVPGLARYSGMLP